MLKAYSTFLDYIEKIEKVFLTIGVSVMTVVMIYGVILRYVFTTGNAWSDELVRFVFIYVVMIGAAMAVRRNSHLQIDAITSHLGKKTQIYFSIGATVAGIVFLAILFDYSLNLCRMANNISPGLEIKMSIPYAAMPIGEVLMILTSVEVILKKIQELKILKEGDSQ